MTELSEDIFLLLNIFDLMTFLLKSHHHTKSYELKNIRNFLKNLTKYFSDKRKFCYDLYIFSAKSLFIFRRI